MKNKILIFLQNATVDELTHIKKQFANYDYVIVTNNEIESFIFDSNYKCLYSDNVGVLTYRLSQYLKFIQPDIIYTKDLSINKIVLHAKKIANVNSYIYVEEEKLNKISIKLLYSYMHVDIIITSDKKTGLWKLINKNKFINDVSKYLNVTVDKKCNEKTNDIDYEYSENQLVSDFIMTGGKIGKKCSIPNTVHFGSEPYLIEIGNYVRITDWVKFLTHDGGTWTLKQNYGKKKKDKYRFVKYGKIKVGDNTHIGWNTIIMPNVTIGKNCVIGCGAIVTHDIPDNSVAVGVPAKVIETIDEYYKKNKNDIIEIKESDLKDFQKKKEIVLDYIDKKTK